MTGRLRRAVAALGLAAALACTPALAGCSQAEAWHPVTVEESQLLAASRFQNYDAGVRSFSTATDVQGQELLISGWYDFTSHTGYAAVGGAGFDTQAMLWSEGAVAIRTQVAAAGGMPVVPVPEPADQGWAPRALDPTSSTLDTLLASFSLLGADRPDNPLLLQQAGALWIGEEEQDGVTLDIFAGPPSDEPLGPDDDAPTPESAVVKYAVDDNGVMQRVDLLLGAEWVSLRLGDDTPADFAPVVELAESLFAVPEAQADDTQDPAESE